MARAASPTPAQYRALAEFRYRIRRFLAFSDAAARAEGLSPQQHQLLLAIKGLPLDRRPTVGVLAERMQLRHHSVVELADRLEEHRLLRRVPGRTRREVELVVTDRGDAVLARLSVSHRAEIRALLPRHLEVFEALGVLGREAAGGGGARA